MTKFLIISDGHGDIEKLHALKPVAEKTDAVIFAGDFAAFQKIETGRPFLQELLKLHKHIVAVLGNCDPPDFEDELKKADISITNSLKEYKGFYFTGSGGGSKFTGTTPYERTDEELVSDLSAVKHLAEDGIKNLILVCHNPPYGGKTDKVAPLIHVGSKSITRFIKVYKPLLTVSGHIHESYAIDKIGETVLINPGALMEGRYAVANISLSNGKFKIQAELKRLE